MKPQTHCQGKQECNNSPVRVYVVQTTGENVKISFCQKCWEKQRHTIVNAPLWEKMPLPEHFTENT